MAIISLIRDARPNDAFMAEEGGLSAGTSGVRWLVDPLDGTVNYLYGIPHWSVSICAMERGRALAAVVYDPVRSELFAAEPGQGARLNEAPLRASDESQLGRVLLTTGFSYVADERGAQARQQATLIPRIRDLRRLGSAALDLAWVAAGRVDAYLETFANPWDWAAGTLLVREAGGRVSDIPGVRAGTPGILASGPAVHDALLALVRAGGAEPS